MHDALTTNEPEIDCPYFEPDWVVDHPDWPPDGRITPPTTTTNEER